MTHQPEIPLFSMIQQMYAIEKKKIPSLRLGQYFLNVVYPRYNNPKLFYEESNKKATTIISKKYCNPDGSFKIHESSE